MTVFGNSAGTRQKVAFAAPYPGRIVPLDLRHARRHRALPEGFVPVRRQGSLGRHRVPTSSSAPACSAAKASSCSELEGDGLAFVHAGGTIVRAAARSPARRLRLDTGCLVAFESTVDYDIQTVTGIKTALFGGEGLFFATLTGPGVIWIQSLPFSRLASRIYAAAPQTRTGKRVGEGSVLGPLGDLVMGDK